MRTGAALLALVAALVCGQPPSAKAAGALAIHQVHPRTARPIAVATSAIGADGAIAARFSAYGANRSPPITWSPVARARAYAAVLEDTDAPGDAPFVHWLIWNIPGGARSLPQGLPTAPRLASGAEQGRNHTGGVGYFGPHPPAGPAHHYHLQVFALDETLALSPGADLPGLVRAMEGHVIADGQAVGTFRDPGA